MKNAGGENVYNMQSRNVRAVVSMINRDRSSAEIVRMPSRTESKVVSWPLHLDADAHEEEIKSQASSILRSGYGAISLGVRRTLVALFALLGWPRPTRDNDPGPSAARPCHWERTTLISRRHLPSAGVKTTAASASAREFPAQEIPMQAEAFARVA